MSNGERYYTLSIVEEGASTAAYYSVTPSPNLEIAQGGVMMGPTAASGVLVNIDPQTLQISAPPGSMTGGVTIVTSADTIAGRVLISPPVNVSVVLTLYGNGGPIGNPYIVDPGAEGGTFSWPVSAEQSLGKQDAVGVVKKLIGGK